MRATDGTLRFAVLGNGEHHRLAVQVAGSSIFLALGIASFLLTRRAVGAFSTPLPLPQLMATAAATVIWAILVRKLSSRSRLYNSLTAIVFLMLAVACSYPGTRLADWFVWGCALVAIVWRPTILSGAVLRPARRVSPPGEIESNSEQVLQQLTRVRTEEGQDAIRGMLIGEFAPGERQVTLHIAFCPPFERLPQVEVNVTDDSDATVKLAEVLHNGAQLEVRLAQPATESTNVALELFATDADSD
ncbi:MAG: hypothetical protein WD229_08930 [Pirellulales bacterium]